MIKRIKDFFEMRKARETRAKELKSMEEYHKKLQNGSLFLQYIYEDMKKGKAKMNRSQRRRFDVEMKQNGKFSQETIMRYMPQVTEILDYIEIEQQKLQTTLVGKIVARELKKAKLMENLKK